jgi:roadblock/LC7 domain-containing protein
MISFKTARGEIVYIKEEDILSLRHDILVRHGEYFVMLRDTNGLQYNLSKEDFDRILKIMEKEEV